MARHETPLDPAVIRAAYDDIASAQEPPARDPAVEAFHLYRVYILEAQQACALLRAKVQDGSSLLAESCEEPLICCISGVGNALHAFERFGVPVPFTASIEAMRTRANLRDLLDSAPNPWRGFSVATF